MKMTNTTPNRVLSFCFSFKKATFCINPYYFIKNQEKQKRYKEEFDSEGNVLFLEGPAEFLSGVGKKVATGMIVF